MTLVHAQGVAVSDRLQSTDLQCRAGELVALIGPNGDGKTSLLRALAGIELEHGRVTVDGEDVASAPPTRKTRLLSFLPATRALVWPISTRDVIELGLPGVDAARVDELIDLLELGAFADRPVNSLSTGERSRVFFARALAARPRLLLLDEPLSNLDPYWVLKTLELLRIAGRETGCAILASLHDLSQAGAFDRALLVDRARIIEDGAPVDVLGSAALSKAFGVQREGSGWRIRMPEDRRSSP